MSISLGGKPRTFTLQSCSVGEALMPGISPLWVAESQTKSLRVFNLALESLLASLNLMRTGKVLQRCSWWRPEWKPICYWSVTTWYTSLCRCQLQAPGISPRPGCLKNPINSPGCLLERGSASPPTSHHCPGWPDHPCFQVGKWQIEGHIYALPWIVTCRKRTERKWASRNQLIWEWECECMYNIREIEGLQGFLRF